MNFCCVTSVYSLEGSKEKEYTAAELGPAERQCKLPRISDVDMFGSDVAQQQHTSADTNDNCVHSSGEVEIVPPSPLQHSKSSSLLNTSTLMGTRTTLHHAKVKHKQNLESYPEVESSNDVEPDDSSLSSSNDVVMVEADSCPVIYTRQHSGNKCDQLIIGEKQKPLAKSQNLSGLQSDMQLQDRRGISVVSESHLNDVASVNASDIEAVEDFVTQSSVVDQSFHSCTTEDVDSSEVNICSCFL